MAGAQVSDFFHLFDVDGDGLISYFEYLLIITFLSIPPQVLLDQLAVLAVTCSTFASAMVA